MTIALSAVLIFILLIAPIAFYITYTYGRFTKAGPKFTLLDGIFLSAIFSLFIHALGVIVIEYLLHITIRFDLFIKLFGGELKDLEHTVSNKTWSNSLLGFASYNCIIVLLAIAAGRGLRSFVTRRDIHWNNEYLRLNNKWWYLFNGYDPEGSGDRRVFDVVVADVAVDTSDGTLIYSGTLVGASYDGEALERIYLSDVIRRELKEYALQNNVLHKVNKPSDGISIPSDVMAFPFAQIKNINLNFIVLPEDIESIPDDANVKVTVSDG